MTDSFERAIGKYRGILGLLGGLVALVIWGLQITGLLDRVEKLEGQYVQVQAEVQETRSDIGAALCLLAAWSDQRTGQDCELLMSEGTRTRLRQHRMFPR